MDWLDLLAVQGTLKSLLQHHSSKASILCHSALFTVQLSHPYITTGKTIALTRWTGKITWRRPWLPGEYFYLENPMNWGVWQTTVHRITKSWTQLKRLSMHAHGTVSWVLENERRTRLYWIGPQTVGFRRRGDEEETTIRQQQKLNRIRELSLMKMQW